MADLSRKFYRVYTKASWDRNPATWVQRTDLVPVQVRYTAAPGTSQATVKRYFGRGGYEDGSALPDGSLMDALAGAFVRITVRSNAAGDDEAMLFAGVFPTETFDLKGQSAAGHKSADHTAVAFGLEYLLRSTVTAAYVANTIGDISRIDWTPGFNHRTRTGGIVSNRSVAEYAFDGTDLGTVPAALQDGRSSYVFVESGGTAWNELWNARQMLDYLRHFMPSYLAAGWAVEAGLEDFLYYWTPAVTLAGKSVWGLANKLISPQRGMSLGVSVDLNDQVTLRVWSLLETPLELGAATLAAHDAGDTLALSLWTDPRKSKVTVHRQAPGLYDAIEVTSGAICACGTFSVADGTLAAGWTDAAAALYKAGVSGAGRTFAAGKTYAELSREEQGAFNDLFRSSDRLGAVYQHYLLAAEWNWKVRNGGDTERIMNPDWIAAGGAFGASQAAYWNGHKRLLPYLPFKEGVDYTAAEAVDENADGAVPDWRRILAVVQRADGTWMQADTMQPYPAVVQAMADQPGVIVRANPPHVLADGHFDGAEPSTVEDLATVGADYETLLVTAMLATDQTLRVRADLGTNYGQVLTIPVPGCELWYVVEGTVTGVGADGTLERFGGTSGKLRDDTDMLWMVLMAATAWYGRDRYRADIVHEQIVTDVQMGTLLTGLNVEGDGSRGACVSGLVWDFTRYTTTVTTDAAQLEFKQLAALGQVPATPGRTRSERAAYTELQRDVEDLKKELAAPPRVRPGTAAGSVLRFGVVTEGVGADQIFVGNLLDSEWQEITEGAESGIDVTCETAAVEFVEVGQNFCAIKKKGRWWCLGLFGVSPFSSDYPSSDAWSSNEEPSSAALSSGETPSSNEPSSAALSSGETPSSHEPPSDAPSSDALSSGETPSSGAASSDAPSSGAPSSDAASSDAASSDAPSSGETPSSDAASSDAASSGAPSSDAASSDAPSSGLPSSDTPSSDASSQGSTGLSSDHPSSDAVSSGDWYTCPDTLTVEFERIGPCGGTGQTGSNACPDAVDVNGVYTLTRLSGCVYKLETTLIYIRVTIQEADGTIAMDCADPVFGGSSQYFDYTSAPVRRGGVYANNRMCKNDYNWHGTGGVCRVY
jgi:hypothetical protein